MDSADENDNPTAARTVRGFRPRSGRNVACPLRARRIGEQRLRIRVVRLAEELLGGGDLDHAPEIHDHHPIREMLDHAEVVADEQVGQPQLVAQRNEQVEHLRLDRDVERRDRLVADEDIRGAPPARAQCRCAPAGRRRIGADSGRDSSGRGRPAAASRRRSLAAPPPKQCRARPAPRRRGRRPACAD